jgi:hypothetical protein
MIKDQEKLFATDLVEMLKTDLDLSKFALSSFQINAHEKILYDITSLYGGSGIFQPKFGFLEQDIVIGRILKVPEAFSKYFYRSKRKDEIFQPEISIEIKYGDVTTHQLITYSHIAEKIKSIFPRSHYHLVLGYCSVNLFEKVMRHGTNFDRIFNLCARTIKEKIVPVYIKGKLRNDLNSGKGKRIYENLIHNLKNELSNVKMEW